MADYIDRDELLSKIQLMIENARENDVYCDDLINAVDIILSMPSVTVEQKHGHWDYDDECECYVCSNCEMSALNNWRCKSTNSKYCPHCGAKMDEVTE